MSPGLLINISLTVCFVWAFTALYGQDLDQLKYDVGELKDLLGQDRVPQILST